MSGCIIANMIGKGEFPTPEESWRQRIAEERAGQRAIEALIMAGRITAIEALAELVGVDEGEAGVDEGEFEKYVELYKDVVA